MHFRKARRLGSSASIGAWTVWLVDRPMGPMVGSKAAIPIKEAIWHSVFVVDHIIRRQKRRWEFRKVRQGGPLSFKHSSVLSLVGASSCEKGDLALHCCLGR